ncbi:MAG TPA: hypothetical protein VGH33_05280 [Isosphaeraceae bacterium]
MKIPRVRFETAWMTVAIVAACLTVVLPALLAVRFNLHVAHAPVQPRWVFFEMVMCMVPFAVFVWAAISALPELIGDARAAWRRPDPPRPE